jgi:hypothetical protein
MELTHSTCVVGQLLEDIMSSLDLLASTYMHLDPSFEHLIKVTMITEGLSSPDVSGSGLVSRDRPLDPASVTKAWGTLRKLLHSSNPLCRSNGYAWLLELLSAEMAHGGSKQASKLNTYALQRQLSLLGRLERATELDFTDKTSETPTISSAARLLCGLLKAKEPVIRRGFVLVLRSFCCIVSGQDWSWRICSHLLLTESPKMGPDLWGCKTVHLLCWGL